MREICLIHECLVEKFESADKADVVGIAFSEDEVVLESAFYILLFFFALTIVNGFVVCCCAVSVAFGMIIDYQR